MPNVLLLVVAGVVGPAAATTSPIATAPNPANSFIRTSAESNRNFYDEEGEVWCTTGGGG
jgi:hypothetical protein